MQLSRYLLAPFLLTPLTQASSTGPNTCQDHPGCLAKSPRITNHQTWVLPVPGESNPFTLSVECGDDHQIKYIHSDTLHKDASSDFKATDTSGQTFNPLAIKSVTARVEWLADDSFLLWQLVFRDETKEIAHFGLPPGEDPPDPI